MNKFESSFLVFQSDEYAVTKMLKHINHMFVLLDCYAFYIILATMYIVTLARKTAIPWTINGYFWVYEVNISNENQSFPY
jgi:hypothetical protein